MAGVKSPAKRATKAPAEVAPLKSLERGESLADYAYAQLRDFIRTGRLRRGERIVEDNLARDLGVSRTPIREAIKRLQSRGLLELVAGRGLVIAELNRQQIIQLYAMRQVLEGAAARFAAQHASEMEIATLKVILNEFDAATGNDAEIARLNHQFHKTIHEAAHNAYLIETLDSLRDALALPAGETLMIGNRELTSAEEHKHVVAAISARDADAAEKTMRTHIAEAARLRLEHLSKN